MRHSALLPIDHEFSSLVQDILDHTPSVIYVKDTEFRYLLINRQFETLFHVSRQTIIGKTDFDLFAPDLAAAFRANDVRVLQSGESLQFEEKAPQDDGLHNYFSTKFPLRDSTGTIYAIAGISTDTTDRLRAQQEIDSLHRRQHLIHQDLQTAHRIQTSMIPKHVPKLPGFDFAAISVPCSKACGDYFDFIACGENRLGIAVGDVSGHGLGAALEMVETRAILRTMMLSETDPVQCLARLNAILMDDLPDDMFVSLFLGILSIDDQRLTYAAAGHEAILFTAEGQLQRLESTGAVLGLDPRAVFSRGNSRVLNTGDILLIATDGITETMSPSHELFGRTRIADLLSQYRTQSAATLIAVLQGAVEEFRLGAPQRDDMTAVVLKVL